MTDPLSRVALAPATGENPLKTRRAKLWIDRRRCDRCGSRSSTACPPNGGTGIPRELPLRADPMRKREVAKIGRIRGFKFAANLR